MPSPPDNMRCTAKSKRTGERCNAWTMGAGEVCYHHGGASPKGIASQDFKHGRYSKHMPGTYKEHYEEMLQDDRALVLLDEMAVARSRLSQVLARAESGDSPAKMQRLRTLWREMEQANQRGDSEEAGAKLGEVGRTIKAASSDYAAWADVDRWLGRAQRLTESERKRMVEEQEVIALSHHMALMSAMTASVRRHVKDAGLLRAIAGDFGALAQHGRLDLQGTNPN